MQTNVKSSLTAEIINEFKKIVGENYVLYDEETLDHYAHDETENLHYFPDVVIKPRTRKRSVLMRICNAKIPVLQGAQALV
jgi:glycolate oxidase